MKLPIIRQFYQNQTPANLEATLEVLESFSEIRIAKLPPYYTASYNFTSQKSVVFKMS